MTLSEFLDKKIIDLADYNITIFSIVIVLVVLAVNWIGLKFLKRIIEKPLRGEASDGGRRKSIFLFMKYILWVICIAICLEILGIKLTLLLAGSAALLVGLGIGIQQIFNDLVSGLFLLFEGSVQVDDILEVDGMVCKVKAIHLRTSKVVTKDDVVKIVPNHKFITETVTNWTRQENKFTRFRTVMGVSYQSDPELVRDLLLSVINAHPEVLKTKNNTPMVRFLEYADSSINFELVFWSSNIFRIENVMSDLRFNAFKEFKKNNIEIPFPQRDLHLRSSDIEFLGKK